MSDILIRNMEMPTCCAKCEWLQQRFPGGKFYCERTNELVHETWASANLNQIPKSCPLIAVARHGKLVDMDWIIKAILQGAPTEEYAINMLKIVFDAPTVIPSNE